MERHIYKVETEIGQSFLAVGNVLSNGRYLANLVSKIDEQTYKEIQPFCLPLEKHELGVYIGTYEVIDYDGRES